MNKQLRHLIPFFILLLAGTMSAQNESIFAFANAAPPPRFAPAAVNNHKFETAKKVLDKLIKTRGDYRMLPPQLIMNKGNRFIAWMNPVDGVVGIEEKAYDVCRSFGPDSLNALAALLSHELIHYYEKHDWTRHFINANADLEASERLSQMEEGFKFETQADYLGGILAISAGYNTYKIFPELIAKAYDVYGLPEEIDGYPSKQERLMLYRNTSERLRQLHSVYQTANLLTIIGAYETAADYYQHLLREYQSYEVYNNAGVSSVLAALDLMKPEEMPFALPLELDASSRLDVLTTRAADNVEMRKVMLLRTAETWFENALKLAEEESTAYLNKGIVFLLKGAWMDANYWTTKALQISEKNQAVQEMANARIVLGVIAAQTGDKSKAEQLFQQAVKGNDAMARLNIELLTEKRAQAGLGTAPPRGIEMIEDVFLDDFLANPDIEVTAELNDAVFCGKKELTDSRLLLHYANDGAEYILFHQTYPRYTGATNWGIKLGASRAQVEATYQNPSRVLELKNGSSLLYTDKNIIFLFNDEQELTSWIVFRRSL